jgi:type II secretory pathway pseudopilin PulG
MYLSIALVIIALIAGFLVDRLLDQMQQKLDSQNEINIKASDEALSAAVSEQLKLYDARINKTWETMSTYKTELESLRLQVAIRNKI